MIKLRNYIRGLFQSKNDKFAQDLTESVNELAQEEPEITTNTLSEYVIGKYSVLLTEAVKDFGNYQLFLYVTQVFKGESEILIAQYDDKDKAEFYHYRAIKECMDHANIQKEIKKIK